MSVWDIWNYVFIYGNNIGKRFKLKLRAEFYWFYKWLVVVEVSQCKNRQRVRVPVSVIRCGFDSQYEILNIFIFYLLSFVIQDAKTPDFGGKWRRKLLMGTECPNTRIPPCPAISRIQREAKKDVKNKKSCYFFGLVEICKNIFSYIIFYDLNVLAFREISFLTMWFFINDLNILALRKTYLNIKYNFKRILYWIECGGTFKLLITITKESVSS